MSEKQTRSGTSTPGVGGRGTGFSTLTKNRNGLGSSIFFSRSLLISYIIKNEFRNLFFK